MTDISTIAAGIGWLLECPFKAIPWIVKVCNTFMLHVRSTDVEVFGLGKVSITGETISLPAGTARVVLHGRYWIRPLVEDYAIFVKRREMGRFFFWPQGRLNLSERFAFGTWSAEVSLDSPGDYWVLVGRMSPELAMLYEYYWGFCGEVGAAKAGIIQAHPDLQPVVSQIPNHRRIETSGSRLPGLKHPKVVPLRLAPL